MRLYHPIPYLAGSIIVTAPLIGNVLTWQSATVTAIFGTLFLITYGFVIGTAIFPAERGLWRWLWGFFFLLGGVAVLGAIQYYLFGFGLVSRSVLLIWPPLVGFFIHRPPERPDSIQLLLAEFSKELKTERSGCLPALLGFFTLIIDARLLIALVDWSTDAALRSPWAVVSPKFLALFFISTIFLLVYLRQARRTHPAFFLLFLHGIILTGVAAFIYKIGFGFDGFIHRAAIDEILRVGAVLPKTPYYIGAYAVEIFLHTVSGISLAAIDRWLVPIGAALFAQLAIFQLLRKTLRAHVTVALPASLLLFTAPFGIFIATTPQGLVFLLAVISVLLAIPMAHGAVSPWALILLSLAAVFIHPLTGLPLLIFSATICLISSEKFRDRASGSRADRASLIAFSGAILSALLPPLALLAHTRQFSAPNFLTLIKNVRAFFFPAIGAEYPHLFFQIAAAYRTVIVPAIILLAVVGWIYYQRRSKHFAGKILPLFSIGAAVAALILTFLPTVGVIGYEQSNFAERLLILSLIFLLPYLVIAIARFLELLERASAKTQLFFLATFALTVTAAFYLSYPRFDLLILSKGFSTSASDIKAVHSISEDAADTPYVVLSNQAVSAAAVREFGFGGKTFFYAIPTGNQLYQLYLAQVNGAPSRELMKTAMDLTGAPRAYLVLNKYWDRFETLSVAAEKNADKHFSIDNGRVEIYRFDQ